MSKIDKKIIILTNFNLGYIKQAFHVRLSAQWINLRLDIFYRYTLQSLKSQTNQDFEVYLNYDPDSEIPLEELLINRVPLPPNVHINYPVHNQQAILEAAKWYDYLYITRLDSDDLYRNTFIQLLYDYVPKPDTEVLINQNGYLYRHATHTLKNYLDPSPPFFTFIYKSEDYLNGKRYKLDDTGHVGVIKHFKYEILPGRNFIIGITEKNSAMTENVPFAKGVIDDTERDLLLPLFGLNS